MPSGQDVMNRQDLRQTLRARRRALTSADQNRAAIRLCLRLSQHRDLRSAQHIATYLAADGEISPKYLNSWAFRTGKALYLPCINPITKTLLFGRYTPRSLLKVNIYGIYEPVQPENEYKTAEELDVILMPLVGFDLSGNRLGMGGGYYDRALENKSPSTQLIGLAHSQQRELTIPKAPWDVCLERIATEKGILTPKQTLRAPTKKVGA